jgi:predicted acylesterase/phospholipase RssA
MQAGDPAEVDVTVSEVPEPDLRSTPARECDVVMKGGITSGVIYPSALHRIGTTYRIRNIGGASAGAIGAAAGAAAEFGRASGGYERLRAVPAELGDGRLADLFLAQPPTRPLLKLMLAANGADRPGPPRTLSQRARAVVAALLKGFPVASALGVLPGAALAVVGGLAGGLAGWLLVAAGLVIGVLGVIVALAVRLVRKLTVDVPGNMFGICRGHPGLSEWLCDTIDTIAGLPLDGPPLTFGQLWAGPEGTAPDGDRCIDLRMITTCVSEGRPYELPWDARHFFFDPAEWRQLFPGRVVDALVAAVEASPPEAPNPKDTSYWRWEERSAAAENPRLCRLPAGRDLPVIVATRLSLSFPLLISAVPLWTIDRLDAGTEAAVARYRAADGGATDPPPGDLKFTRVWFSDGGFCSNFPIHLFDSALPTRPTFAINLSRFPEGRSPSPDERKNVEWARSNRPVWQRPLAIPPTGFGAVLGFASAALNTSRNWQDSSHLDHPGYRDRIVRVMQTKTEGGINLHMDAATIEDLSVRGRMAAEVLIDQFTEPHYPTRAPRATGWDNHRWVRYRALLSVLPSWLRSYQRGIRVLDIDVESPPSYPLTAAERTLADHLTGALDTLAEAVETADGRALDGLGATPRPQGMLRRIPRA